MRRLMAAAGLAVALLVSGCASTGSIQNPITNNDVYRLKLAYDTTLKLANAYRTECFKRTYAQIMADPIWKPVCQNRRDVVRAIQRYQPPAGTAVRKVAQFAKDNPTVSLISLLGPAWDAVTAFQNAVPRLPSI